MQIIRVCWIDLERKIEIDGYVEIGLNIYQVIFSSLGQFVGYSVYFSAYFFPFANFTSFPR